ncbi:5-oxoprolinase subunit PxpA [soil metagenome]
MRTLRRRIDLNGDLGESPERWASGEDGALMYYLTSANICCGAYAGDDHTIWRTCDAAIETATTIGAQVGYPDFEGFGRRSIEISTADLEATVAEQIDYLKSTTKRLGGEVHYVKPHGALYNDIVHDEQRALAVMRAVKSSRVGVVVGMPGSASLRIANELGLTTVHEGFADRAYLADGTLMPRSEPGAVLTSPEEVATQAMELLTKDIDSICVHSDSPNAPDSAEAIRAALARAGVTVEAFVAAALRPQ